MIGGKPRMKRRIILWVVLLGILSGIFSWSFAESFWQTGELFLIADKEHSFRISFNHPLEQESIKSEHIYIVDSRYQKIPSELSLISPQILRLSPKQPYLPGESYTLVVTTGLRSERGSRLSGEIRVAFAANLALTIEEAKRIEAQATEGEKKNQYPPGSKQRLWNKIQEASAVLLSSPTLEKERLAVKNLQEAIKEFQRAKITEDLPQLTKPQAPVLSDRGSASFQAVSGARSYELKLYKDGFFIAAAIANREERTVSFLGQIRRSGFGDYTVTIRALGDGITKDSPESTASMPIRTGKLPSPKGLSWSGQQISWQSVPAAKSYEVRLIKNGSPTSVFARTERSSHDFSQDIESKLKSGRYTVQVRSLSDPETVYADGDYGEESQFLIRHSKFLRVRMSEDKKTLTLDFDDDLLAHPDGIEVMRRRIMLARGSASFAPLTSADILTVGGSRVEITLSTPLNGTAQLRILPDTLRDNSSHLIPMEILTPVFSAETQSPPQVSIDGSSTARNDAEGFFHLKSTKAGELLLLHQEIATAPAAISIAKKEKKAVSVSAAANVLQKVYISGLVPGNYRAYAVDTAGIFSSPSGSLTITDGIAPAITVSDQVAGNDGRGFFRLRLSESGRLYLIHEEAYQRTKEKPLPSAEEISAAEQANRALTKAVSESEIDQEIKLTLQGLAPGGYHLFAEDSANNRSERSAALLIVRDKIPPVISFAPSPSSLPNTASNTAKASSNEPGHIYLLLEGERAERMEDLEKALQKDPYTLLHKASKAQAAVGNTEVSISIQDLEPGTYYAYAVDPEGNISERSQNKLKIVDQDPPEVIAEMQTVGNTEKDFVFAMSSEGTGALYLIKEGVDFDAAELPENRSRTVKMPVTKAYTNVKLPAYGLEAGKYDLYAVDKSGNRSSKYSEKIVVKLP